jgi:hypothetical protein
MECRLQRVQKPTRHISSYVTRGAEKGYSISTGSLLPKEIPGSLSKLFQAQKIFSENYATKIAGGKQLYAYDHPVCDIAGNLSDREFYPDLSRENLTSLEGGKKR